MRTLNLICTVEGSAYFSRCPYVVLNSEQRKAMADQLGTISKLRLRDRVCRLSHGDMAAVERAICLQLGLST